MPTVAIHPPSETQSASMVINALPQLLRTPSGLAIVEMQGTVNSTLTRTSDADGGATPVGKLVFPDYDASLAVADSTWQKRVHLYVGKYQRLTGEVKRLTKPIAVIRRRETAVPDQDAMEVAEVVYYKLLFAHRPEPVGGGVA